MLLTVSTVKDTLPNLQRFVAGNLAGGADHLVVLLDADQPEERAWLEAQPHVTVVRADDAWWRGERPADLNVRQRTGANLVKAALTRCGLAEADAERGEDTWLFHVDADEVVQVDRAVLAAVPPGERVVRLAPLEAVSQLRWDGDPTVFKRLLTRPELAELVRRGVVERPRNGAYFHGHVDGKSGIRPTLDLWLTLHHGADAAGTELEPFSHERLAVLHFESFSGEDFVRKWTSILTAGTMPNFRPGRRPTALAVQELIGRGLSEQELRPALEAVFRETTEDDLETLRSLDLLVEADWRRGTHVPSGLPPAVRERLGDVLDRLAAAPKRPFHPGTPAAEVERILQRSLEGGRGPGLLRAARSRLRRS